MEKKPRGYWDNYDNCKEEALKYKSRAEFSIKCGSAYRAALRHGWLKDYTWFKEPPYDFAKKKPAGYWDNYDNCKEEALKYLSLTDFETHSNGAYDRAKINGWLKDFTWFKKCEHTSKNYVVYAYEDHDNKVAYVGLSFRLYGKKIGSGGRHSQHKSLKDKVGKYFNGNVPLPKVLKENLGSDEASYYEDYYKKQYSDLGWTLLNEAKTGIGSSSLGSAAIKWDYVNTYNAAKKYDRCIDFIKECGGAYNAARSNNWLKDYTWFKELQKPLRYWWDYDNNHAEAQKYCSRTEYAIANIAAYDVARINGWLDDWFGLKIAKQGYWDNYENCKQEALKFTKLKDFQKKSKGAANAAYRNGWIDDFYWLERRKRAGYWDNYENCKEESKKYTGRTNFSKGNYVAYNTARTNGWLDDFFPKAA